MSGTSKPKLAGHSHRALDALQALESVRMKRSLCIFNLCNVLPLVPRALTAVSVPVLAAPERINGENTGP